MATRIGESRGRASLVARRLSIIVVGLVAGSLLATYWHAQVRQVPQASAFAALDPRLDPEDPGVPLLRDGVSLSLEEAEAILSFPVYRPQAPEASDESIEAGGVRRVD
jgi:hypothetical protein